MQEREIMKNILFLDVIVKKRKETKQNKRKTMFVTKKERERLNN